MSVDNAVHALIIGSYVNETAHNVLIKHTGSEGGCPRINWYKLRDEIAAAIEAAIDDFSSSNLTSTSAPKTLEWGPVVEGGRDIQSQTEFGLYVISVDSSFAGGMHYLWTPDQREYDADHHSEHSGMTSARAAAQADYEARILSALTNTSGRLSPKKIAEFTRMASEYRENSDNDHGARMQEDLEMFLIDNLEEIEAALTNTSGDDEAVAKRIVQAVCELQEVPDHEHPDTVVVTVQDLEACILNHLPARPQSAAVRDEWQPIETAPKDGTEIIAAFHQWGQADKPYTMQVVSWCEDSWANEAYPIWSPTHWMPLPAAPALHSTQEG